MPFHKTPTQSSPGSAVGPHISAFFGSARPYHQIGSPGLLGKTRRSTQSIQLLGLGFSRCRADLCHRFVALQHDRLLSHPVWLQVVHMRVWLVLLTDNDCVGDRSGPAPLSNDDQPRQSGTVLCGRHQASLVSEFPRSALRSSRSYRRTL